MSKPSLGVCYYPEHWPEDQWKDHAAQMVAAGLTWVRIGEFAWSRIEPAPDRFNWGWLDHAIDTLSHAGLKIVMSTPTATPPRWMIAKHPDMIAVDKGGQPRNFGSRRHYCFSHEGYKKESARIAKILGQRYGKNPDIQAWQIDNEYGCHDTSLSYSTNAETAFRIWLIKKYATIESLNAAWGNVFWSMEYTDFNDIALPNLTVTEPNPAHVMDFRRFSSDQIIAFNRVQCDVLRDHTQAPLIHNYMGRITEFDHFKLGADLEIASWDSYPLGFLEDRSDQDEAFKTEFARQGDPDFQAFHHDIYRAVGTKAWWIMEQQPGPVNWAPYNPAPLPGMVRLWTWEAMAHGAEVVSYFRWKQAPFAQEQMHAALKRPDGQDAAVMDEVKQVAKELDTLQGQKTQNSRVAIVFDYASAWAWETQPQSKDFDYFRLVFDFYRGLRRAGLSVDILPPSTDDFGERSLIFIPGLFSWNAKLETAISKFEGDVVIGPRSGSKTQDFQISEKLPPGLEQLNMKVVAVESLRPGNEIPLKQGGAFRIWNEFIESSETVSEQTVDGHIAITNKENIHYLAGWPDDTAMSRILKRLAVKINLETICLPRGIRCRDWGDTRLYINYNNTPAFVQGHTLPPADILLIHKDGSVIIGPKEMATQ